jgi:hypothetical protein
VRITSKHPLADVARYSHNRLVRNLRLGELSDCVMPQIVEAETGERAFNIADIGLACSVVTPLSG